MTKTKDVLGILFDAKTSCVYPATVTVRISNDKIGKSLSLSAGNVMIEIPLESLSDYIDLKK